VLVTDTGIGIRVEDQKLISKESVKSSWQPGSGNWWHRLGLAITRRLVEQHGKDTLSSELEGKSFYFTLPAGFPHRGLRSGKA